MPELSENQYGQSQEKVFGEVGRNWIWLLALGILFVILGFIGLGMTFAVTLASVLFFGVLLLIGSGAQFVEAVKCKGWKSLLLHVLIAFLYLIAGIGAIVAPLGASVMLTLMIAGALIFIGLSRAIMAFQMRKFGSWLWLLLGGIISVVLGGLILANWPVSGLWIIGLFVSIELIVNGWSYIFVALAARNA
ncbi:HdeD family acid-resistance protein [Desulfomonile tiedjei]|uniref:HdeD family acid-resistance protein n=1 Tax=Desulfomonile tiedjei (strain ATCC 49306 / DSM 6799 / DCB-1) TaxID=706587 RepID=I4C5R7_DESTA|nr:HdeD family acid-resistance protein [Desulfomonile tiedjei]AFM24908.1 hypothetical protein Desti_2217 [Desulfomonile tiedjei DSM 6799]